jgi:3-methyl-2-oxobutanoate hydroxymethyltransferase
MPSPNHKPLSIAGEPPASGPAADRALLSGDSPLSIPPDPGRLPMTLPLLGEKKRLGEPIVMVTAYDYPSARAAEAAGVDLVLVGDSAATTVLGYSATTPVRLEDMLVLAAAARRGLKTPLLIGDLPFGSYEVSDEQAIASAVRMVQDAGCDAVKLEGGSEAPARRARAIVSAGIPVMGHVGLTPQTSTALGGWKAQGRTAKAAAKIGADALALQEAGCFAVVFEAIPADVTAELIGALEIPVIGIGAGPDTDGQVLVFHDLLGIREGLGPRFVKRYANLQEEMNAGLSAFAEDVRARRYPGPEHIYSIDPGELAELRAANGGA